MNPRRHFLASIAAGALVLSAAPALAASPMVEIVAMAHPPVVAALKPLRDWLARWDNKLRVIELDAESPAGAKRLQAAGLAGHVPILILIDGKHSFRRKDGSQVAFVKFPNVADSPPGMRGNWVTADAEAVLTGKMMLRPGRPDQE
jgi:hypothetical protein